MKLFHTYIIMVEKRKRSNTNNNGQVSNMMNRLNAEIKKAGGLNKYVSNLRNSRAERQRKVMNILRSRHLLTPATSRMLNNTPVKMNAYIKGQNTNAAFVNAVSRMLVSKNKNQINRSNLARYLLLVLKNINQNKLYPYSNYYNNNNKMANWYSGYGPYNSQPNEPPLNAREEWGSNYTNFEKLKNRKNFMNMNQSELLKLASKFQNIYRNYRSNNMSMARNTLGNYFRSTI